MLRRSLNERGEHICQIAVDTAPIQEGHILAWWHPGVCRCGTSLPTAEHYDLHETTSKDAALLTCLVKPHAMPRSKNHCGSYLHVVFDHTTQLSELRSGVSFWTLSPKIAFGPADAELDAAG